MYRLQLPIEFNPGRFDQAGTWHVVLQIGREAAGPRRSRCAQAVVDTSIAERRRLAQAAAAEASGGGGAAALGARTAVAPYSVLVHSYSDVSLRASLRQPSYEPGTTATVEAVADAVLRASRSAGRACG